ncbi:hypothetical protein D3C80_747420 [compost metagenome]
MEFWIFIGIAFTVLTAWAVFRDTKRVVDEKKEEDSALAKKVEEARERHARELEVSRKARDALGVKVAPTPKAAPRRSTPSSSPSKPITGNMPSDHRHVDNTNDVILTAIIVDSFQDTSYSEPTRTESSYRDTSDYSGDSYSYSSSSSDYSSSSDSSSSSSSYD